MFLNYSVGLHEHRVNLGIEFVLGDSNLNTLRPFTKVQRGCIIILCSMCVMCCGCFVLVLCSMGSYFSGVVFPLADVFSAIPDLLETMPEVLRQWRKAGKEERQVGAKRRGNP